MIDCNTELKLNDCVKLINDHLTKIDYFSVEKIPEQAFLHLIEETGKLSRCILHKNKRRNAMKNGTLPDSIEDEFSDVLWQVLKLSIYLDIDVNKSFINKYNKNVAKGIIIKDV